MKCQANFHASHRSTCLRKLNSRTSQRRFFCDHYANKNSLKSETKNTLHTASQSSLARTTRLYFEKLGVTLGIKSLDDWYENLSTKVLLSNNGKHILSAHQGSPSEALRAAYPEHNWVPWKFNTAATGFWKSTQNQRKYFDWLGKELGVQHLDDWYETLSTQVMAQRCGPASLSMYKGSPKAALMAAYPEHNWMIWKFDYAPIGYWKAQENQRKYFDWLGKELGVQHLDDWYEKLSQNVVIQNHGQGLLSVYKGSPINALMTAYPDHNWIVWKFNNTPVGYWKVQSNQKKYFDWLGKELGIQHLDDWYENLSKQVIAQNYGQGLLSVYKGSPKAALLAAYPEHNWIQRKFKYEKRKEENIPQFLAELSEKLSIQTLDDWYRVDYKQLSLGYVIEKHQGLYNFFKTQFPHHPWDPKKFQQKGKKTQRWLAVTLKKMFPNDEILEDYMHPKAIFPDSNRPMQLDVFIPSKNLAFEYQGIQHFEDVGIFSPSKIYQQRDEEKKSLCAANNIKLIEVPYWWNRTQQELQEMMSTQLEKFSK